MFKNKRLLRRLLKVISLIVFSGVTKEVFRIWWSMDIYKYCEAIRATG